MCRAKLWFLNLPRFYYISLLVAPMLRIILSYHQIVRILCTKSYDFLSRVTTSDSDFICTTESWLTSDYYDRQYFDDRYAVFRCDRSQENVVRTQPLLREWPIPPRAASGCIWLSIPLNAQNYKCLHIACVCITHGLAYRALMAFFDVTGEIINDHPNDIFLITGDFNVSNAVALTLYYDNRLYEEDAHHKSLKLYVNIDIYNILHCIVH